jgi:hypothetical protein
MIIGIAGAKRSGKDTAARYLARRGFTHDSFAAPIREFTRHLLGLTGVELEEQKEVPQLVIGGKTPRELMQKLGTEFIRQQFDSEAWVKSLFARNRGAANLVISDVRFGNEAVSIVQRGGFIIRINRVTGIPVDGHVSEQRLPNALVDYEVDNDGTVDDMFRTIDEIVADRRSLQVG